MLVKASCPPTPYSWLLGPLSVAAMISDTRSSSMAPEPRAAARASAGGHATRRFERLVGSSTISRHSTEPHGFGVLQPILHEFSVTYDGARGS